MGPGAEAVPRLPAGDGPGQRLRALRVQRQGARRRGAGHSRRLSHLAMDSAEKMHSPVSLPLLCYFLAERQEAAPELCIYMAPRFS